MVGSGKGFAGIQVVSQETYDRVLDIVFPRDEPRGDYGLVLRFKPSFHPESQVVIKRGVDKIEVSEYKSVSGNIYSKLNELKAHGGASENAVGPNEMIKWGQIRWTKAWVSFLIGEKPPN